MYCTTCGAQMPAQAHFCPGCGAALSAQAAAANPGPRPRNTQRLALFAGVALVAAVAVLAVVMRHAPTPAPGAPATVTTASTASTAVVTVPAATAVPGQTAAPITGFDWTGLTHEQLLQARSALDAAIAREEHSSSAATAQSPAP